MASIVTSVPAFLFFDLFLVSVTRHRFRIKDFMMGKAWTERQMDFLPTAL